MNRFVRGDWASAKALLDGAIDRSKANAWDGTGFGANRKTGYRGMFLGVYLSATRICAPVLRQKGFQLKGFDANDHSATWDEIEVFMWKLWGHYEGANDGGGIPGRYTSASTGGVNFDSEGNIAATYVYACSFHDRVRAAALAGGYNATSPPGVHGDSNSILVNGHPAPDGSPVLP